MPSNQDRLDASLKAAARPKVNAPPQPKRPAVVNVAKAVDPGSHATAAVKPAEVEDTFEYDVAVRAAFVGLGQGGAKLAQAFWDVGYRRVAAVNTTDTDFHGLAEDMPKLSLEIGGAAKDMEVARRALTGRDEDVRDLLARAWGTKVDCVIVCVGLGGGTGGGLAMPVTAIARRYMADHNRPVRVGALVALPSDAQGQAVARNAVAAFNELAAAKVSPLIIVDNDKVQSVYSPAMSKLFPTANATVSQLFHVFNQLAAARSPHITFDRSEFSQLLDNGIVVFGSADLPTDEIKTPADVSTAIRDRLAANVLADVDVRTGDKAACVFVASDPVLDAYSQEFFAAGFTQLDRIVGQARPDDPTVVHRGLYPDGESGLQCYTLVSGLAPPTAKLQALSRAGGLRQSAPTTTGARHLNVD